MGWEVRVRVYFGFPRIPEKVKKYISFVTTQQVCRSILAPQITCFDGSYVYIGWVVGLVVTNGRLLERGDP